MSSCTTTQPAQKLNVGMGQIAMAKAPALLSSVLGSCVGLALFHPRLKTGALAHIVLPTASGRGAMPGKFADTALPHMLAEFSKLGVPRDGLVAKIAGGACMFGVSGPLQIGDSNVEAVQTLLAKENIRIVAKDVGGQKGRRVTLDCSSGELLVEIAGKTKKVL
jgi:chemotaxis protein CheD